VGTQNEAKTDVVSGLPTSDRGLLLDLGAGNVAEYSGYGALDAFMCQRAGGIA